MTAKLEEIERRYKVLLETTRDLAQHIEWLLPFLDRKAKESGDVAGLQLNAREAVRHAREMIATYETLDKIAAEKLARED